MVGIVVAWLEGLPCMVAWLESLPCIVVAWVEGLPWTSATSLQTDEIKYILQACVPTQPLCRAGVGRYIGFAHKSSFRDIRENIVPVSKYCFQALPECPNISRIAFLHIILTRIFPVPVSWCVSRFLLKTMFLVLYRRTPRMHVNMSMGSTGNSQD